MAKQLAFLLPAFYTAISAYAPCAHAGPIVIGILQPQQIDWSDWIPAGIGLLGVIVAAFVGYKSWVKQQRWANRERYYTGILSALTKLKISLEARADYYQQPSTEHDDDIPKGDHFQAMSRKGNDAFQQLQELIGPASIFLSKDAVNLLEKLIRDYWENGEFSICTAGFVQESLKITGTALEAVLAQAKEELMS